MTTTTRTNELLTANELAAMIKVTTRAIWSYRDAGAIPQPVRIGGATRWHAWEIAAWMADGCPHVRRTNWRAERRKGHPISPGQPAS